MGSNAFLINIFLVCLLLFCFVFCFCFFNKYFCNKCLLIFVLVLFCFVLFFWCHLLCLYITCNTVRRQEKQDNKNNLTMTSYQQIIASLSFFRSMANLEQSGTGFRTYSL